ncbi:MAG: hypothetical protein K5705_03790 [Oscillospiraceae bacterium]|nr:hypothetical protein [Oscillospiraceae bacterium]
MDDKFCKVDLHVHTPASKCYVGDKTENGYWEILRSAVNNGVRLVAITDHNTIAGYEKLVELRDKTLQEYQIIQKYNIPDAQKKELQEKVDLFNNISFVMGVEITLNPGVHIIVLCNDDAKNEIESLLSDIGYSLDRRGCDDDFVPDMDIKTFLSDDRLSGKIVLAPHVDSHKGIWKALEGNYRAAVFKSNTISAITCNSASQLDNIKSITVNDPLYKRNKPFVCVNASDAHQQSDIGIKHSYFKLTDYSFAGLKNAFDNSEECISDTETQGFIDYVKKCIECKPTIFLEDFDDIEKACYAILNQGYGCVLLGLKRNYQQIGISKKHEQVEEIIKSVFESIQNANDLRFISYKYKVEKLGNGRCVGIIIANSDSSRLWIDNSDSIYVYCEKTGFKLAGSREIEKIIRERLLTELQDFEERNNENIWDAMAKMKHVLHPVSKYSLYDKFKSASIPISYYFDAKFIQNGGISGLSEPIGNGLAHGNVFYTDAYSPRLKNAVLRYSCPVYQNNDQDYLSSLFKLESPAIVISIKGGCHILDSFENCYFDGKIPAVLLVPNERFMNSNLSLHHVIAWLKTDCFIWTCIQKNNDVNLCSPEVLFESFIPFKQEFYDDTRIADKVKDILALEQKFLDEQPDPKIKLSESEIELITEKCEVHNALISDIAAEIELIIKNYFDVNEDENDMIKEDLFSADVFQLDLDEQEDLEFEPEPVTQ